MYPRLTSRPHYTDRVFSEPEKAGSFGLSGSRLGLSLRLFFRHFGSFIAVTAPVAGLMAGFQLVAALIQWPSLISQLANLSQWRLSAASTGWFLYVTCAASLVGALGALWPWMDGALTYLATERALGRPAGAREAWRAARPQWGALWVINTVRVAVMGAAWLMAAVPVAIVALGSSSAGRSTSSALAVVLLALCCLPVTLIGAGAGAVIGAIWGVAFPASVAEAKDGFSALARSAQLTAGARTRMMLRSCALAAVWVALNAPFVVAQTVAVLGAIGARGNSLASAGMFVLYAFASLGLAILFVLGRPLNAIFYTCCYFDLRERAPSPAPAFPAYSAPGIRVAPAAATGPAEGPKPDPAPAAAPAPSGAATASHGHGQRVPPLEPGATPAMRVGHYFNRLLLEGDQSDILNELGMAYMDVGDLGAALDALQRARALAPNDPDVIYNQMRARLARGDVPGARRAMAEYLRSETNSADREATLNDPRFKALL